MQIKKFVAPTLKEAIEKMKFEFGSESIVLSTKVLEANIDGIKKKMFEITAGADEIINQVKQPEEPFRKSKSFEQELKKLSDKVFKNKKISNHISLNKSSTKLDGNNFSKLKKLLLNQDLNERIVEKVLLQVKKYYTVATGSNINEYIISALGSLIPTASFEVTKGQGPKVIALVGPTGVGKTTCIAKLAVISKMLNNLNVGLISIDTYRLGAMDQLKIFSDISNIDFHVAYEPNDVVKSIKRMKNKDLIFIDTVGRSQNKTNLLEGINDFLTPANVDETYLVLSSVTTLKNMIDVAEKFKTLEYNGLVFTKLDEAVTFGNIVNLVDAIKTPVKYLTNGQVIPDDIIAADSDFIAKMIYSGSIS